MFVSIDFISILHRSVLAAFVAATSVSMLVTLVRRLRIRRPHLAWRRRAPLTRIPLGPTVFLLLVALGIGQAWAAGRSIPLFVVIGYPAGGLFWFVASWLLRTVLVTECGIVHDVSRLHDAVVWSQIVDYFTKREGGQVYFVFFYRGPQGDRHRLDLPVPERHVHRLRRYVDMKLEARFRVPADESMEVDETRALDDRIDMS